MGKLVKVASITEIPRGSGNEERAQSLAMAEAEVRRRQADVIALREGSPLSSVRSRRPKIAWHLPAAGREPSAEPRGPHRAPCRADGAACYPRLEFGRISK